MSLPDLINGSFEALGGLAVALSCIRVYRDKSVKGISIHTVLFFTSWGFWNTWYYPSLHQTGSAVGAIGTCIANCCWVLLIYRYKDRT